MSVLENRFTTEIYKLKDVFLVARSLVELDFIKSL